ncbi:CoA pyrophosphatase [Tessaracoccus sp. OH4464_COT-324]|uniref:NUDIX hydrolase n=1 Tax=Tessaracoccus sp. OH4464_COT-324 TaxID=2491059 RepID=UPI0035139A9E
MLDPRPRRTFDFDRSPRGKRSAAVLMLLSDEPDPELVLCERAHTMRRHAGQYALPGGRIEPGESVVEAALREAEEEVGLTGRVVEVLGQLPPLWVPKSDYDVTPVVANWPGGRLQAMDPAETASVLHCPVSELADDSTRVTARHPLGFTGPAFVLRGAFIWGLTAHLIDWLLDLGGWARPWEQGRVLPIPDEYLRD